MKTNPKAVWAAVLLGIFAASCAEETQPPPPSQTLRSGSAPAAVGSARTGGSGAGAAAGAAVADDSPVIPKDAQYTILCMAVTGEGHSQIGQQYKEALTAQSGRKDIYLVSSNDETDVYCGFYRSSDRNDPDGKRAQADRVTMATLTINGGQPFGSAVVVQLQDVDPPAPSEWNLANKDADKAADDLTRAYWSLQIAAFKDDRLRKQAAVQMVRDLRENQKVEAYFYHGESVSSVCVGTWPQAAVQMPQQTPVSADETQLVSGNVVVPQDWKDKLATRGVHTIDNEAQVVDPTLVAMKERFPAHAVNYEETMRTVHDPKTGKPILDADGKPETVADPSFLVIIPRHQGTAPAQRPAAQEADPEAAQLQLQPAQDQPAQGQPAAPSGGRLRSLGGD